MGLRKCIVQDCGSIEKRVEDRGVTFHRFPAKPEISAKWIERKYHECLLSIFKLHNFPIMLLIIIPIFHFRLSIKGRINSIQVVCLLTAFLSK